MFTTEHLLLLPKLELGCNRGSLRGSSTFLYGLYKALYIALTKTGRISKTVERGVQAEGDWPLVERREWHDNGAFPVFFQVDKPLNSSIILV